MHQKKLTQAVSSTLPMARNLRVWAFAASCAMAGQVSADPLHFTEAESSYEMDAMEKLDGKVVSSIQVDDGVSATMTGDGELTYVDATDHFRLGGTANGETADLDLSGVTSFHFDNKDVGFSVGGQVVGEVGNESTSGTLVLANVTNVITTSSFGVADVNRNSVDGGTNDGTVRLGKDNTINADSIIVGGTQGNGSLSFQDDITGGSLVLRGTDGESRVGMWNIGVHTAGAEASGSTSSVDLTNGSLDAKVDFLQIGVGKNTEASSATNATLIMGTGTLDATTIIVGKRSSGTGQQGDIETHGTLTLNGGTVRTEHMLIGDNEDDTTGNVSATINLNDGATLRAGSIAAGTGAATRDINWNNGIIGNLVDSSGNWQDMTISAGIDIRLSAGGDHTFQVDGEVATATVESIISDADQNNSGALTKSGLGKLVLNADNTYTGATTVDAGSLAVNGSIASATTVNENGTLGGSGTVKDVTLKNGGALTNEFGGLTVDGDLTFEEGSIYRALVNDQDTNHGITVNGTASLAGGAVDVKAGNGRFEQTRRIKILSAGNALTDEFGGLTSDFAFLTASLDYDTNDVYLDLDRNSVSYTDVANTGNQRSVSHILQNAEGKVSGDAAAVIDAITTLSEDQARAAYDAIGGAGAIALRRAGPVLVAGFNNQLRGRLDNIAAASSSGSTLAAAPQRQGVATGEVGSGSAGQGVWIQAYGQDLNTRSDGNASSAHGRSVGWSIGVDAPVSDNLILGAAYSYGSANLTTDNDERGKANSHAGAVYADYTNGPWHAMGYTSLARHSNNLDRRIVFGSIDRTAASNFGGSTASLYGEVSYELGFSGWKLQPLTGFALSRTRNDGYSETGAGALNLQVGSQTVNSVKTLLGTKAVFETGKIEWQPRAIWSHEHGNVDAPLTAQLEGMPGSFNVRGVGTQRDALIAGLTVAGRYSQKMSLFADVQGEFSGRQSNLGMSVGLRAAW